VAKGPKRSKKGSLFIKESGVLIESKSWETLLIITFLMVLEIFVRMGDGWWDLVITYIKRWPAHLYFRPRNSSAYLCWFRECPAKLKSISWSLFKVGQWSWFWAGKQDCNILMMLRFPNYYRINVPGLWENWEGEQGNCPYWTLVHLVPLPIFTSRMLSKFVDGPARLKRSKRAYEPNRVSLCFPGHHAHFTSINSRPYYI
jgi:hypothetical protein